MAAAPTVLAPADACHAARNRSPPSLWSRNPSWPPYKPHRAGNSIHRRRLGTWPCPLLEKKRRGGKKKGGAQEAGSEPGGRGSRVVAQGLRPGAICVAEQETSPTGAGAAARRPVCVAEQETPPPLHPLRCARRCAVWRPGGAHRHGTAVPHRIFVLAKSCCCPPRPRSVRPNACTLC
jgi:hypothetical protein